MVLPGQPVAVMEALKMEHVVHSEAAGVVREIALEVGDTIFEGTPILFIEPREADGAIRGRGSARPRGNPP